MTNQKNLHGDDGPDTTLIRLWGEAKEQLNVGWDTIQERFPEDMPAGERNSWLLLARDGDLSEINVDDVHDPEEVSWLISEGMTPAEAVDNQGYRLHDGGEIPVDVLKAAKPAEEWDYEDPSQIGTSECTVCGETLYYVETEESCWMCGWDACGVDASGEIRHSECVTDYWPYDYDPDSTGVMCGWCYEDMDYHGGTIIVMDADGTKYKAGYMDTVIRDFGEMDREFGRIHRNDQVDTLVKDIVLGNRDIQIDGWRSVENPPDATTEFVKVGGGWHSSMERSEFSDRVNEITGGEAGFDFPVAVVFSTTSNVCSTGIDIYAPQEAAETVRDFLEGEIAAPAYAGLSFR